MGRPAAGKNPPPAKSAAKKLLRYQKKSHKNKKAELGIYAHRKPAGLTASIGVNIFKLLYFPHFLFISLYTFHPPKHSRAQTHTLQPPPPPCQNPSSHILEEVPWCPDNRRLLPGAARPCYSHTEGKGDGGLFSVPWPGLQKKKKKSQPSISNVVLKVTREQPFTFL